MASIPLVNLKRQYAALRPEIAAAMAPVLDRQAFINGEEVVAFGRAWLKALGASHGTGCSNGTAAIVIALKALGIGPGDEVITPAHTFIATVEAICAVGATPVFADIERTTYCIDVTTAPVSKATRAVLPVHLYGTAADMDTVMDFARAHGLKVVEDTAQAHLAAFGGRTLGTLGDAGTFSFYPGKNLGAYGDAGFIVARDESVAATAAKLVDHGRESKYLHDLVGENQRMDELQAAVLSVKLKHLPRWNDIRRKHAAHYDARIKARGFKVIDPHAKALSVYHLYVVEVSNRDAVLAKMKEADIAAGVHYPVPLHRQPAMKTAGFGAGTLRQTEEAAARVISLPICADITSDEVDRVCDVFLSAARP